MLFDGFNILDDSPGFAAYYLPDNFIKSDLGRINCTLCGASQLLGFHYEGAGYFKYAKSSLWVSRSVNNLKWVIAYARALDVIARYFLGYRKHVVIDRIDSINTPSIFRKFPDVPGEHLLPMFGARIVRKRSTEVINRQVVEVNRHNIRRVTSTKLTWKNRAVPYWYSDENSV